MRALLLLYPGGGRSAGLAASGLTTEPGPAVALRAYHDALRRAGVLLAYGCVEPPAAGARITFAEGRSSVVADPPADATLVPVGYWLLQVASREEAIIWAARCPAEAGARLDVHLVAENRRAPGAEIGG